MRRHLSGAALALAAMLACGAAAAQSQAQPPAPFRVIEYYNKQLDHYFMSADPAEQADLDTGKHPGWEKTGQSFFAYPAGSGVAGAVQVCRYYGTKPWLDTHFYSASAGECKAVKEKYGDDWMLESADIFEVLPVSDTSYDCPSGAVKVFRLWNNRRDVNHRYTSDVAVYDAMKAQGYIPEGTYTVSNMPVIFCGAPDPNGGTPPPPAAPPPGSNPLDNLPVCTISASTTTPTVGQTLTLTATCTHEPSAIAWQYCVSNGTTCTATATSAGPQTYTVRGSNTSGNGPFAQITIDWQPGNTPQPLGCSLSAPTTTPIVGTPVTISANCTGGNGSAISYAWTGCAANGASCTATSATTGAATVSMTASQTGSTSVSTQITLNWQPVPPAPSCTLSASNTTPYAGTTITLSATCSNNPASYRWTGCLSSSASCAASEPAAGAKTYSVVAVNPGGSSAPASVTVNWQTPPPSAPSNCTIATTPANGSLPASGGAISMSASCSGAVTSWAWTKQGAAWGTSASSQSDTLPANSGQSAASYTYQVTACNGTLCAAPVAATFSVAGTGGGGGGAGLCSQYQNVVTMDLGWGGIAYSKDAGGFAGNGVLVVRLTIPAGASGGVPNVSAAEYIDPPTYRQMTVSNEPCDFRPVDKSGVSGPFALSGGNIVDAFFVLAPASSAYYPTLVPGQTYYFNLRNYNPDLGNTCGRSTCNVVVKSRS